MGVSDPLTFFGCFAFPCNLVTPPIIILYFWWGSSMISPGQSCGSTCMPSLSGGTFGPLIYCIGSIVFSGSLVQYLGSNGICGTKSCLFQGSSLHLFISERFEFPNFNLISIISDLSLASSNRLINLWKAQSFQ